MDIQNVLASLAVKDVAQATQWYTALLGAAPTTTPMATLAEWKFKRGGWLQVYELPERAGQGSCTLTVADIAETAAHLRHLGIATPERHDAAALKVLMIKDPDGNSIAFAETDRTDLAR